MIPVMHIPIRQQASSGNFPTSASAVIIEQSSLSPSPPA
jgi:hypothetical protein